MTSYNLASMSSSEQASCRPDPALAWGEFFGALIPTGPNTVTAPVSMANFISYNTNNWSALAAAGVVVIVPVLVATVIAQRRLVSGLTAGAVRQ
jgi:multiple sugar transport system permease protein